MIKNYFKIAWRSLWNNKAYSLINVVGLSVGLIGCLIVATVVFDELSYDHQWTKAEDIYRVLSVGTHIKSEEPQPMAFSGFGPSAKRDLPEVADYCRMSVTNNRLQIGNSTDGVVFKTLQGEESLWNLLDFNIVEGNPKKFVKGYTNLIITKKIEQQYFAGQNAIGKVITSLPEYGEPARYIITGVVKSIPQNTHLKAEIIIITEFKGYDNDLPKPNSGYYYLPQYLLLKHGTQAAAFTKKINKWYADKVGVKNVNEVFKLQPMKDIYLRSDFNAVQPEHGSIRTVYIFGSVAILLLLIACINFINLTISRVFNRAKETGIRKVLGAGKFQLIMRFLAESIIFFALSFILALLLYPSLLVPVQTYLGHPLVLNLFDSSILTVAICAVLLISLLTGLYPAWFLSRPQPSVILRNKTGDCLHLNLLKKGLVVGQFVISATIITATIVVHNQLNFISHKDLGYDKNNLLTISYNNWGNSGEAFKQAVKQLPEVESTSLTQWAPGSGGWNMSKEVTIPGQKEKVVAYFIMGDADLAHTLKLRIKTGRLFSPQIVTDAINSDSSFSSSPGIKSMQQKQPYLATNYTASLLGLKINKPAVDVAGIPVGVVEDFNSESLHSKLQPTLIQALSDIKTGNLLIRVKAGAEKNVLNKVNATFKSFYPDKPFIFNWVNEQLDVQYKAEYKLQQLFTCFSLLIVLLACLGLFGLVSFTAEQRIKEIGIRKVLGASVNNIVILLAKDYVALVVLALLIASPIAWYAMNKWLQDFAYRVNIAWWVFALTAVLALCITLITVSFQAIKAAIANPVKSLRSE